MNARTLYDEEVERYGRELADRFLAWDDGGPEPGDEEMDRHRAGLDPDLALVLKFLDDRLGSAAREAVLRRFASDRAFRRRYFVLASMEGRIPARRQARPELLGRRVLHRLGIGAAMLIATGTFANWVRANNAQNAELSQGRAVTRTLYFPRRLDVGDSGTFHQWKEVGMRLAPKSRLTLGLINRLGLGGGSGWMALDGEARVETHEANVVLITNAARLYLRANGRFIVRAAAGDSATVVDVVAGSMTIERAPVLAARGDPRRIVSSGERAALTRQGRLAVFPIPTGVR